MSAINPLNVISMLLDAFKLADRTKTPVTSTERELTNILQNILLQAMEERNTFHVEEEESLQFEDMHRSNVADVVDIEWRDEEENDLSSSTDV